MFDAPIDTEVLRLEGFFDALNPDKPPANFDIIIGSINFEDLGIPEWTYYLPAMTNMTTFQVTDVGGDLAQDDNTNYFLDSAALSVVPELPSGVEGQDFLRLDNGIRAIGSNGTKTYAKTVTLTQQSF